MVAWLVTFCGLKEGAIQGQSEEGGLGIMTQWTSAMGAAQLARLLNSQQERPRGPAPAAAAYRALADGIRLLVLEGRVPGRRAAARRAGARAVPLRQPYDGRGGLRGAARRRVPGVPQGSGQLDRRPRREPAARARPRTAAARGPGSHDRPGLRVSLPAPEPWLTRAVQGALEELPPYAHTHGDYPAGLPALRAMIAEGYTARGIPTMPSRSW